MDYQIASFYKKWVADGYIDQLKKGINRPYFKPNK